MAKPSGNPWSKDSATLDIVRNVDLTGKSAVVTERSEGIRVAKANMVLTEGEMDWLNGRHICIDVGLTPVFSSSWDR